jgi:hypothetical protein
MIFFYDVHLQYVQNKWWICNLINATRKENPYIELILELLKNIVLCQKKLTIIVNKTAIHRKFFYKLW